MALFDSIRLGSSAAGDYEIERSLRFNKGDSPYLVRTPSSAGNRRTWTWSSWVKYTTSDHANYNIGIFQSGDGGVLITQSGGGNPAFKIRGYVAGSNTTTTQLFRDPSAWFHVVLAVDTTQSTSSNRVKLYINGVQVTSFSTESYPSQNAEGSGINNTSAHYIGSSDSGSGRFFDGYLAEINFIDGLSLTPSSFAETDAVTGEYKPKKYAGSYGTNGFYLNFSDNSGTTATTLGKDLSGNGHNFTPNNFSVSAGAGNDSLEDTPTNNFCTLNPLDSNTGINFSQGNLVVNTSAGFDLAKSTFYLTSGKWYWEVTCDDTGNGFIGVSDQDDVLNNRGGGNATSCTIRATNGDKRISGSTSSYGSAIADGDVMMFAVDKDSNKFWAGKNGTWFNSGDPAAGSNEATSALTNPVSPSVSLYDNEDYTFNFGQRAFSYTPPTGYKKICSANLPDPTIKLPDKHFDTLLYTGNNYNGTRAITGYSFQPDWIWTKNRTQATSHHIYDEVRGLGAGKELCSDKTQAEGGEAGATYGYMTSYGTGGFNVVKGSDGTNGNYNLNINGNNYAAWAWNAGGSTVTNNDGTISTQVRANTTAGFSIVSYTGNGSTGTVGHGLGVAPDCYIVKERNSSTHWYVYHKEIGATHQLKLNTNDDKANNDRWQDTDPTSSVFYLAQKTASNGSGDTYIAYCFSEVAGYSKFGSYKGNGSTDGTFVYTGFRPAWVLVKDSSSSYSWDLHDNKRDPGNVTEESLAPNLSNAKDTYDAKDFLANGFKLRSSSNSLNKSGDTYIYLAFAESPFKYSRAR